MWGQEVKAQIDMPWKTVHQGPRISWMMALCERQATFMVFGQVMAPASRG